MDERSKHRIIGTLVIASVMIIFAPIWVPRTAPPIPLSNPQHFEIPKPPPQPRMAPPQESYKKTIPKVIESRPAAPINPAPERTEPQISHSLEHILKKLPESANLQALSSKNTQTLGVPQKQAIALNKKMASSNTPVPNKAPNQPSYVVQVGSFANAQNAARLVDKLKSQGYAAYKEIFTMQTGQSVSKVMVGALHSATEAASLILKLEKVFKIKGIVKKVG